MTDPNESMAETVINYLTAIEKSARQTCEDWDIKVVPEATIRQLFGRKIETPDTKGLNRNQKHAVRQYLKKFNQLMNNSMNLLLDAAEHMGAKGVPPALITEMIDELKTGFLKGAKS